MPNRDSLLAKVAKTQAAFAAAEERRTAAMLDAVRAGVPLRAVGQAAGCSHEAVRALADQLLGVTLVLPDGARIPLNLRAAKALGQGIAAFAADARAAEGDARWARAAAKLAHSLEADRREIRLDRDATFAVQQTLLLFYRGRASAVAPLRAAVARALA